MAFQIYCKMLQFLKITNVSKAKKTQPHKQQRRERQKMSEQVIVKA